MTNNYVFPKLLDNFKKYISYDTTASNISTTYPSTDNQLVLLKELKEELLHLKLSDVTMDQYGYVKGKILSNQTKKIPSIVFIAHVDTTFEENGKDVEPRIIRDYKGGSIQFPKNKDIILDENVAPILKNKIGKTIITASGNTLLGADDKAGIAEIMSACEYLINNPEIPHGDVWVLFTPDEEIGNGTKYIKREEIDAEIGYTLDGSAIGSYQDENFNAVNGTIKFKGFNTHPGSAKNRMINAVRASGYFLALLPLEHSPEKTEKKEGFIHPGKISGDVNSVTMGFIIRDFEKQGVKKLINILYETKEEVQKKYSHIEIEININEAYSNMKEIIKNHPDTITAIIEASKKLGITPYSEPIRGGTDGARLSFMDLPCPNIWTGGYLPHSKFEFAVVEEMESASAVIIEIIKYFALK